jgi:OOP family OmpA-OmpF porin
MAENPEIELIIEGHTGSIGADAYNKGLAERRAKSAYDYLVKAGISAKRLTLASFGESKPDYDNSTEASRRLNRRVELRVKGQ